MHELMRVDILHVYQGNEQLRSDQTELVNDETDVPTLVDSADRRIDMKLESIRGAMPPRQGARMEPSELADVMPSMPTEPMPTAPPSLDQKGVLAGGGGGGGGSEASEVSPTALRLFRSASSTGDYEMKVFTTLDNSDDGQRLDAKPAANPDFDKVESAQDKEALPWNMDETVAMAPWMPPEDMLQLDAMMQEVRELEEQAANDRTDNSNGKTDSLMSDELAQHMTARREWDTALS